VRLEVEIDDVVPLLVDPDRLRQVVWNLLSNAAKFTPGGGRIAVRARQRERAVRIEVADTGIGIDPEVLPFVFNRFWQADSAATRAVGGLGLGLAIVRHLVDAHGGVVEADSPGLGHGSTFAVTLPVNVPAAAAALQPRPDRDWSGMHPLYGVRVLAVDDEADSLDLVAAALRAAGAEVRTAGTADAAIEMMTAEMPDVMVADIAMPGRDGHALVRELRQRAAGIGVPAVALTAYAGELHRRAALDAGFTEHLEKPVNPDRLASVVAELTRRPVPN
jgi:CheY-like chemotaxis protein